MQIVPGYDSRDLLYRRKSGKLAINTQPGCGRPGLPVKGYAEGKGRDGYEKAKEKDGRYG